MADSTRAVAGDNVAHYGVLKRSLFTEKGARQQGRDNTYSFAVATTANKVQIRHAVEALFDVKVLSVRTMNCVGKLKRVGASYGRTAPWKKALVTLKEGDTIEQV